VNLAKESIKKISEHMAIQQNRTFCNCKKKSNATIIPRIDKDTLLIQGKFKGIIVKKYF